MRNNKCKGVQSPRRRAAIRLVTFTDQIGGSLRQMRDCYVLGINIDQGPQVRGAGAGTLNQDWDSE